MGKFSATTTKWLNIFVYVDYQYEDQSSSRIILIAVSKDADSVQYTEEKHL